MLNRNVFIPILFCLLLAPASAFAADASFLTVIDGDSILVEFEQRTREVRLIGIDAPEWGQEWGVEAKAFAMNFCFGREIRLEFDRERFDKYGRLLAYVWCGERLLNRMLVREGLALAVPIRPNTRRAGEFSAAEAQARKMRKGIWAKGGLKQTPAQWRQDHRKKAR